jgi:N-acetylneuraminate synthase
MNLRTIPDMAHSFDVPVGLSDHTLGTEVALAAVAVGACIIEKHFTLSREIPSLDAKFSVEPSEFKEMVRAIRLVEKSLGGISYAPTPSEASSRALRRSLFVVMPVKAGETFTERNVRSIRPGSGLPPKHLKDVLGRKASRDIEKGTPLGWDMIVRG